MIKDISLYQFKNFADEETVKFSQLNLIYGCNGRGKSSILQAVLVLAQTLKVSDNILNLRLNGEFVGLEQFDDVLCSYANNDERYFSITITTSKDSIKALFIEGERPQLAKLSELIINGNSYGVEVVGEQDSSVVNIDEKNVTKSFLPTSDVASFDMLRNVFYISADRMGPRNTVKRNDNRDEIGPGKHGENLIQVLYQHPDILSRLTTEMSYIFNGATIQLPSDEKADDLKLLLDSANGKKGYKPSNVGFGYSHVLPIMVQVLLAPKDSILIIENPEAHLHPGAQSRFIKFIIAMMKERNLQVFIETHSDHVINGARLAVKQEEISKDDVRVLFVSSDPYDDRNIPIVTPILIESNGAMREYPDDFMDEWTKQSRQLFR